MTFLKQFFSKNALFEEKKAPAGTPILAQGLYRNMPKRPLEHASNASRTYISELSRLGWPQEGPGPIQMDPD